MTEEEFKEELFANSTPVYATYEDLKEQYQAQYSDKWKPRLATDMYELVVQDKELKDPRNSTLRAIQRHEKGTYSGYAAKYTDAFQALAESMGPLRFDPPSGGFQLDITVEVYISGGPCEERQFSVYLSALDASRLDQAEIGAIPQTTINDLLLLMPHAESRETVSMMEELFPRIVKPFPDMETTGNDTETRLHVVESTVSDASENRPMEPQKTDFFDVETGIRETVKRMKKAGMKDRDISQLVGLTGRKYPIYKQILAELGELTEERVEA